MAKKQFQAESKRLLDLMINSIYTNHEIFIRELISNASDAIDKFCYLSLTDSNVGLSRADFAINIKVDKDAKTLTVSDNGIGMDQQALEDNLGVIAKSGSLKFKEDLKEKKPDDIDIIGQFGVGFYSAFMVSDVVTVTSKAYGQDKAYQWVSSGADGYVISECEKDTVGTEIVMQIKPDTENEKYSQFLEEYTLRNLIKKYSNYIRYPIKMDITKSRVKTKLEDEAEDKAPEYESYVENETLNDMIPIWHKAKKDVSDDDYENFYKEKFFDQNKPIKSIHISTEGVISYESLMFIPSKAPYDYFTKEYEKGLQLYSNGVMIMEKCSDLLPEHLRFVKGIVDSSDLSLNISREILQQDRQLQVIATSIEKKITRELTKMLKGEREKYEEFFTNFGIQLKYGVANDYGAKKDAIKDLLLFYSSTEKKLVSLAEYVSRMKEEQKTIYYACGDNIKNVDKLPQIESIKEKGYEILYLTDEVDDFVMSGLREYDNKEIKSVNSDDIVDETEKKDAQKKTEENQDLLTFVKDSLDGKIKEAKISQKLKTHPICLSSDGAMSLEMEKYFNKMGSDGAIAGNHILELNGSHKVFIALTNAFENDKEKAKKLCNVLYNQALLIAGFPIDDPTAYSDMIFDLLA